MPAGSPAGSSAFEIYVMNADGSNQVRLTNNLAQDTFPAWSPDGSRIAFLTTRDSDIEIYSMRPDGTDPQRLTTSAGEDAHPTWSPDGAQIAFHSRRDSPAGGTALEIYRMDADGSNPTRVTTGDGFKYFPIWSPDGKRIAFNGNLDSTDSANTDVYHVNALDGSDLVRVTTAAGFDGRCDWLALPVPVVAPPPPVAPPPAVTPPAVTPPAATPPAKVFAAKLSLARARLLRGERMLDVLAPITSLASGDAKVELHAAGMRTRFSVPVSSVDGRIRFKQAIAAAQARLGTGIVTLTYGGDADTRPQTVRLRAAAGKANLSLARPTIVAGRLRAAGTISTEARGVVRVQIQYESDGQTRTLQFLAPILDGKWSMNEKLARNVVDGIERRTGTVHSYTLFTGYMPRRMRGEMRSYQVLGNR